MVMYIDMYFTRKLDGPSIEKYIAHYKLVYPQWWRLKVKDCLNESAKTEWRNSVNHDKVYILQDEEFEQLFLEKWSHAKNKNNEIPNRLSSFKVHKGV